MSILEKIMTKGYFFFFRKREVNNDRSFSSPVVVFCNLSLILHSAEPLRNSKFGATRCQTLRRKCTKFEFRRGFSPDPAGGAYSAPPDPLAVFKEAASKGREGRRRRRKKKGKKRGASASEQRFNVPLDTL